MRRGHSRIDASDDSPHQRQALRRRLFRIYMVFGATLLALFTVTMIKPVYYHVIIPFNRFLAWSSTAALHLFGSEGVICSGTSISSPSFGVDIAEGCNGIYAMAIVLAGVAAMPARWTAKLIGLALAVVLVMVLNYIRIITLWYAGITSTFLFSTMHLYVWEFVIIALGAAYWYVWYEKFVATD